MAKFIDKLYAIASYVLIGIFVLAVIGSIVVIFYLRKKKKKRVKKVDQDYSNFNRKDAKNYIKYIDDIKDDMIITDGGTRFVGVIDCQGFDFYSAHAVEQGNTVQNYLGFINTINKPISYRQYSKSVDLEDHINRYKEKYDEVCTKLNNSIIRLNEMQAALSNYADMDQSRRDLYISEIEKAKREKEAYEFRKVHMEDEMLYINRNTGVATTPMISETYVIDWTYNPMEFSVELSEDEILARAKNELESIANAKIHALSVAGVKAKRCNTDDLIEMFRRHSQPISAERYKMSDVKKSSYFEDITSTDTIKEVNEYVRDVLRMESEEEFRDALMNAIAQTGLENDIHITAGANTGGIVDESINEKKE